jgi:hypothetical protein
MKVGTTVMRLFFFSRFSVELDRFSCHWLQAPQRATSHGSDEKDQK